MVDVQVPFIVYRKTEGFQIRTFGLFKLFPVSRKGKIKFLQAQFFLLIPDKIYVSIFIYCD